MTRFSSGMDFAFNAVMGARRLLIIGADIVFYRQCQVVAKRYGFLLTDNKREAVDACILCGNFKSPEITPYKFIFRYGGRQQSAEEIIFAKNTALTVVFETISFLFQDKKSIEKTFFLSEKMILAAVEKGLSYKQMQRQFDIGFYALRYRLRLLYSKFHCENKKELALALRKNGLYSYHENRKDSAAAFMDRQ